MVIGGGTVRTGLQCGPHPHSLFTFSNYFFYLLQQVIQSLVILRTLSKVQLRINNQRLFLLRSPLTEARQRRRATGGPNNFCKTTLFILNL